MEKGFRYLNNMVYFAHPINTYGSDTESECLSLISNAFPNNAILNPSDAHIVDAFDDYKETHPHTYMEFFAKLVNRCTIIVFLPFRDGMIGAGVWYEIQEHVKQWGDYQIWCVDPFNETIYQVSESVVTSRKLSVEETRKRIKTQY